MTDRRRMPDERKSITKEVKLYTTETDCNGEEISITKDVRLTMGFHDDDTLGEIFVDIGKHGNNDALYHALATSVSIGLQYGIPLEAFTSKFKYTKIGAHCFTNDDDIPSCGCILDWIFRRLDLDFSDSE